MKKVNYLWICVLSILLAFLNSDLKSQSTYDPLFGHYCVEDLSQYLISSKMSSNTLGGAYKPERTNTYSGTSGSSVFRVLIVYVQFPNDTIDVNNSNWDTSGAPSYMNSLLAETRSTNYGSEWWNAYSETTQRLSDYWMEVSRGNMHMVGNSYYVKLSHPWWWYVSNGSLAQVNSEIHAVLDNQNVYWPDYDNWTLKDNTFKYEKDGQIDMMYVVHRTWKPIGVTPGSIALLYPSSQGNRHVVSSGDTIVANFGADGSGCTFTPGAACGGPCGPFGSDAILGLICHELGHYHFGYGHGNYGVMMGNGAIYGMDCRHSPWETIKLSYITPKEIDFSEPRNGLKDFSSRTSSDTGEILKVPINGSSEFFLIASRNKVSSYDRIMLGDTAHDNPYRVINPEYGKGVYIYHVTGGYTWTPTVDQECADGLFYWHQNGTFYPDWVNPNSPTQFLPINVKDSVSYNNDFSTGGYNNVDEKSLEGLNWGGIGKANTSPGYDGTDRIYVTDEVAWTSRSWKGDRWDAWKTGYNEVFSPYSSPSTKDWYNNASEIFIYLNYRSSSIDSIMIYKVGENNMTEEDILQLTPPSRPMGLNVSISECDNDKIYPVLTWNHNMEPDMIQGDKLEEKRYKVFRGYNQYGTVPDDYWEVADLLIHKDEQPVYLDMNAWNPCWDGNYLQNSIRYKIIAIDSTNWASVYSDFVSFSSEDLIRGDNMGNFVNNNTVKKYELSQNYPNPFNPVTKINYALPKQGFVSLKIYDITGREIQTLVNEVKQAGYYTVDFNGSHLSSGVYFYRIQSGNFVSVKRMVLIK